jgi:hypothetical protein
VGFKCEPKEKGRDASKNDGKWLALLPLLQLRSLHQHHCPIIAHSNKKLTCRTLSSLLSSPCVSSLRAQRVTTDDRQCHRPRTVCLAARTASQRRNTYYKGGFQPTIHGIRTRASTQGRNSQQATCLWRQCRQARRRRRLFCGTATNSARLFASSPAVAPPTASLTKGWRPGGVSMVVFCLCRSVDALLFFSCVATLR